eukprot:1028277-Lingulodinium_polyedra.AAC.1
MSARWQGSERRRCASTLERVWKRFMQARQSLPLSTKRESSARLPCLLSAWSTRAKRGTPAKPHS